MGICYSDGVGGHRFALLAASAKENGAKESRATRGLFLFNVVEHDSSVGYKHAVVVFSSRKATNDSFLQIMTFTKFCLVVQSGERDFALNHQRGKAFLDGRFTHF